MERPIHKFGNSSSVYANHPGYSKIFSLHIVNNDDDPKEGRGDKN